MRYITELGNSFLPWILITLSTVILYVLGFRWEAVTLVISSAGGSLSGALIKTIVVRPRPTADLVQVLFQIKDYSFPSGHVVHFLTFYGFLAFLTFTLIKKRFARRTLLLLFFLSLIILVGISRIYFGSHWASDVLGGYLLGNVWLALTIYIYRWGKQKFFIRQPLAPETTTS